MGKIVNQYIQQIYRERCEAAEATANRVQELTAAIVHKLRRMAKDGVLYSSAERKADSEALEEAQEQFRLVLESVYEIEDAEKNG
jgi:hypothetical protein